MTREEQDKAAEQIIAAIKANEIDLFFQLIASLDVLEFIFYPGHRILNAAAKSKQLMFLEHLLSLPAAATTPDNTLICYSNALHAADETGNIAAFKSLFPKLLEYKNLDNFTRYLGFNVTNLAILKYMLEFEEIVRVAQTQTINDSHPLYAAAMIGNPEFFNCLLKFPWELSADRLLMALNHAVQHKQTQIIKILVTHPLLQSRTDYNISSAPDMIISLLVYAHDIESLNLLLELKWIANDKNEFFDAYGPAAYHGNLDIAERLLMLKNTRERAVYDIINHGIFKIVERNNVAITAMQLALTPFAAWQEIFNGYKALTHAVKQNQYKMAHAVHSGLSASMLFYITPPRNLTAEIDRNLKRAAIEINRYCRLYRDADKSFKQQPNLSLDLWARIIDFVRPGLSIGQVATKIDHTDKAKSLYSCIATINHDDKLLCDEGAAKYQAQQRSITHLFNHYVNQLELDACSCIGSRNTYRL